MNVGTKEPALVAQLVSVVNHGWQIRSHNCATLGDLTFEYDDGTIRTLPFRPGHDAEHYEFAKDGVPYRISRQAFIDAAVAMGIAPADLPR